MDKKGAVRGNRTSVPPTGPVCGGAEGQTAVWEVVLSRETQGLEHVVSLLIKDQEFCKSQWKSFRNWVPLEDVIRRGFPGV